MAKIYKPDFETLKKKALRFLGFNSFEQAVGFSKISEQALLGLKKEEQIQFLRFYLQWLQRFVDCVNCRQKDARNYENNKLFTRLVSEAKLWDVHLKEYQRDLSFSSLYDKYTTVQLKQAV